MLLIIRILNGSELCMNVTNTITILELKKMIELKVSIPFTKQRIIYKSKQLDNESRTLLDYNMNKETEQVYLINGKLDNSFKVSIKIMWDKTIDIHIHGSDTILDIKTKIYEQERYLIQHQKLICNGEILNNNIIINDECITTDSKLYLIVPNRNNDEAD